MYQGSLHREGGCTKGGEREGKPWKQMGIIVFGGRGRGRLKNMAANGWWQARMWLREP